MAVMLVDEDMVSLSNLALPVSLLFSFAVAVYSYDLVTKMRTIAVALLEHQNSRIIVIDMLLDSPIAMDVAPSVLFSLLQLVPGFTFLGSFHPTIILSTVKVKSYASTIQNSLVVRNILQ